MSYLSTDPTNTMEERFQHTTASPEEVLRQVRQTIAKAFPKAREVDIYISPEVVRAEVKTMYYIHPEKEEK